VPPPFSSRLSRDTGTSGNLRGRPKGSRNKRTIADQEIVTSGMSPLAFLCSVFRDPRQPMKRRIEAARCAALYCHAKLATTVFEPTPQQFENCKIEVAFVTPPEPPDAVPASNNF
jgi:hypothetical protein